MVLILDFCYINIHIYLLEDSWTQDCQGRKPYLHQAARGWKTSRRGSDGTATNERKQHIDIMYLTLDVYIHMFIYMEASLNVQLVKQKYWRGN